MKLYFIHGFGETPVIFGKIAPALPQPQVFLNVWELLGNDRREDLNVLRFAEEVIEKYKIQSDDVIIGHSMGGWIAYHIKHLAGCRIVQIASWTDADRIISPIKNAKVIYWLTRRRWYLNDFQKWLFLKTYRGRPSLEMSRIAFENLLSGNRECVINQLKLILEPVEKINVTPDLRIHAHKDEVIRRPKQPFHEVPGDHFTLVTHPATVIEPIKNLLFVPS